MQNMICMLIYASAVLAQEKQETERNTILLLLKQGFCRLNNRKYKISLKSFLRPSQERIEYIKHVIGVKRLNKE